MEVKTKANTLAPEFVVVVVCLWFRQQRSFHWLLSDSPFLFVLARSPDAIECASKWEATPQSHAWHHQLRASSLLLEMPLSQHPFFLQGNRYSREGPCWVEFPILTAIRDCDLIDLGALWNVAGSTQLHTKQGIIHWVKLTLNQRWLD